MSTLSTAATVPGPSSSGSSEPCPPFIPPELVSLILLKLWEGPLTPQDRLDLLKNVAFVNHTWLALAAGIACQDIHITSTRSANAFLRLLSNQSAPQQASDLFTREGSRVVREACRSISFYVDRRLPYSPGAWTTGRPVPEIVAMRMGVGDDAAEAISLVLDTLSASGWDCLPNLRHIGLQYYGCGPEDALGHLERGTFPPQVTRLSVDYTFTTQDDQFSMTGWSSARSRARFLGFLSAAQLSPHTGTCGTARMPTLRQLSLSQVKVGVIEAFLEVCPGVERLELTDPQSGELDYFVPLPAAVRTLVLRHRGGVALSDWWFLRTDSLVPRLFREGPRKPLVVLRAGAVGDAEYFRWFKRDFARGNPGADIVHEREEIVLKPSF